MTQESKAEETDFVRFQMQGERLPLVDHNELGFPHETRLRQLKTNNFSEIFLEANRLFKINAHMLEQQSKNVEVGHDPSLFSHDSKTSKKVWLKVRAMLRFLSIMRRFLYKKKLLGLSASIKYLASSDQSDVKRRQAFQWIAGQISQDNENQVKKKWYILYEDDVLLKTWIYISTVLFLYTAIFIPYKLAFLDGYDMSAIDLISDILLYVDIVISLFTSFHRNGKLVDDLLSILLKYLQTWFIIDFVSVFPFELLSENNQYTDLSKLPRVIKLIKIFRLIKLSDRLTRSKFVKKIISYMDFNRQFNEFFAFFAMILVLTHITGCFWYFLAKVNSDEDNWLKRLNVPDNDNLSLYIISVYWAVTTICTVGFGDIVPVSTTEKVFNIVWICVGVAFYSYTIGTLSSILAHANSKKSIISSRFAFLNEFAKEKHIDKNLLEKITINLEFLEESNQYVENDSVNSFLDDISLDLTYKIAKHIHQDLINKVVLFSNKDINFVAQIIPYIKPRKLKPDEIIYQKQEYASFVYFIISGRVGFFNDANKIFKTYIEGSYFGEIEIFKSCFRQNTAKALNECHLLLLPREVFLVQMENFPEINEELLYISMQRDILNKKSADLVRKLVFLNFNCLINENKRKQFEELQKRCHNTIIDFKNQINDLTEKIVNGEVLRTDGDYVNKRTPFHKFSVNMHYNSKDSIQKDVLQKIMSGEHIDQEREVVELKHKFDVLKKDIMHTNEALSELLSLFMNKQIFIRKQKEVKNEAVQCLMGPTPSILFNDKVYIGPSKGIIRYDIPEVDENDHLDSNLENNLPLEFKNGFYSNDNSFVELIDGKKSGGPPHPKYISQRPSIFKFKSTQQLSDSKDELSVSLFKNDERAFGSMDMDKSIGFLTKYFKKVSLKRKDIMKESKSKKPPNKIHPKKTEPSSIASISDLHFKGSKLGSDTQY